MQLDLSFFDTGSGVPIAPETPEDAAQLAAEMGAEQGTKLNFLNAVVRVAFVQVAVVTALTPPTLAFAAAVDTQPVLEEDGTFLWTYVWRPRIGHAVTIHLRGRIDGVTVHWTLDVTDPQADPPLEAFTWFWGETSLVSDHGFWVFNDIDRAGEVAAEVEMIRIDWDHPDARHHSMVVENIRSDSAEFGDTLSFVQDETRCTMEFYDASEDILADITWNEHTGAGSIMVPDYRNGERGCWNETQDDVECPGVWVQ
jgi:hypothetical protein